MSLSDAIKSTNDDLVKGKEKSSDQLFDIKQREELKPLSMRLVDIEGLLNINHVSVVEYASDGNNFIELYSGNCRYRFSGMSKELLNRYIFCIEKVSNGLQIIVR